jgi:ubiquinone/menaquinone biosynthesis C-methylase UbiE
MSDLSLDQKPQGWDAVVPGYEKAFESYAGLFAQEMLAQVKPGPGHRVIDIGAGPGILTMLAAPSGADVLSIDFSPNMVERLQRRLHDAGVGNARAEVMNGQDLKLPDGSFDIALSNFAVIFFPEIERGLSEMHRVLKSGGRIAMSAWSAPDRVMFLRALMRAVKAAVPDYAPPAKPPVWLRLSEASVLRQYIERAGFRHVRVEAVTREWRLPSAVWLAENFLGISPGLSFIFDALGPEKTRRVQEMLVQQLRDDFKDADVRLPNEALIAFAEK